MLADRRDRRVGYVDAEGSEHAGLVAHGGRRRDQSARRGAGAAWPKLDVDELTVRFDVPVKDDDDGDGVPEEVRAAAVQGELREAA
jgi:hypothetical protein